MIPAMNIVAWGNVVPWAEQRQIEQDLIISRALIALFSDPELGPQLRFRGGTALNKLHFPKPLRYSEDIDLVRTEAGPIGPVLDRVRALLEPWLGRAGFDQSPVAPKLQFRADAEDGAAPIRLKVEINTREIEAYDPPLSIPFNVENPWFSGAAEIATFSLEEILASGRCSSGARGATSSTSITAYRPSRGLITRASSSASASILKERVCASRGRKPSSGCSRSSRILRF